MRTRAPSARFGSTVGCEWETTARTVLAGRGRGAPGSCCSLAARRLDLLRDDAVVVAIGSHQHDARALDAPLLGRAAVVVEDITATLDEAGDVVLASAEGALTAADLGPVRDVVTGSAPRRTAAGL